MFNSVVSKIFSKKETEIEASPFYDIGAAWVVLFHIISYGYYEFYWHYRHWKAIKQITGDDSISPVLRGLFFPVFAIQLFSLVRGAAELAQVPVGIVRTPLAIFYVACWITAYELTNWLGWTLALASPAILGIVQLKVSNITKSSAKNTQFSGFQSNPDRYRDELEFQQPDLSRKGRVLHIKSAEYADARKYYTIEFFACLIVVIVCLSASVRDAEYAKAKTKFSEVFSYSRLVSYELADFYAFSGTWKPGVYNYLFEKKAPNKGLVQSLQATSDGDFALGLNSVGPYVKGDSILFVREKNRDNLPFQIYMWRCRHSPSQEPPQNSTASLKKDYLPFICRDPDHGS